jgi:hypothetical protein
MGQPVALFFASIGSSFLIIQQSVPTYTENLTVSGIIFVIQILNPSQLSHYIASKNWVLIWGATATALLWELTSVISITLMIFRRSLLKSLGEHLQIKYADIITTLLECTVLLSSFSIFFMVAYSVKSPSLVMVPFLLPQVQVSTLLPCALNDDSDPNYRWRLLYLCYIAL